MFYSMGQAGIRVCLMLNSLITLVTRKVLRWHYLKCCMAESAGHHCFGIKQGKARFWSRSFARGRKEDTNSEVEFEGCIVSSEELC